MSNLNSPDTESKYNRNWFKQRAFNSLKRIGEDRWDYSDSLLLYVDTQSQEEYEKIQTEGNPYNELVTVPEEKYLTEIADEIMSRLPNEFEYIDLGPGTAGKEKFIFEAAKKQSKKIIYSPVDISKYYLEQSKKYATEYGLDIRPLQCSFEELSEKLEKEDDNIPRFISLLGLTFSNFEPLEILKILKKIARENGFIFINSQIRERTNITKLVDTYHADIKTIIKSKISFLGLNESDYTNLETDNGIRLWFTVANPTKELKEKGVKPGDKFLVFQSLRPTIEILKTDLDSSGMSYAMFDTGSSFIGILLRT